MKKILATIVVAVCAVFGASAAKVDLSTVTANKTLVNGDVAYGTLGANVKVSIAAGATVTISNAVINSCLDGEDDNYDWAGLTCNGDATIILKETNVVKGFYEDNPGIFVPFGHTLTITGDGSLTASSNGYGAGIGGGYERGCGNIVIAGGTITATGGNQGAAGIGGGYAHDSTTCGNITISGGTVTATGGRYAAGIGCGIETSCGDIAIRGGTVVARGGENGAGIGGGYGSTCGSIAISRGAVDAWGGQYAAGIGCGYNEGVTSCGRISFSTGLFRVSARCGTGGKPIGAGKDTPSGTVTVDSSLSDDNGSPTRTITGAPPPQVWDVDLSTLTADETARDGAVIHGTLGGNYKVSIADGATVTLSNAVINADGSLTGAWAGLTCEGNATIVLAAGSESVVKAFNNEYPGIFVPVDCMLTIQGTGSLTASAKSAEAMAAGIGGGCTTGFSQINCGSISIAGGIVIATGGTRSAGIGSAYRGTCGDITIGAGITRVVATRGEADGFEDQVDVIGAGLGGNRGTVTVDSSLSDDHGSPTRTITGAPPPQVWDGDLSTLTADATAQDGTVIHGELHAYVKVSIAAGARVTISNVTIEGPRSRDYQWAGLTCLGDAEIVLVGTNTVIGAYGHHPGIFVPAGSTLTISGSGVLTTSSHGQGAGIGGGYGISCGNIVINGGTITATGGDGAAGIGGGLSDGVPYAECGDITINGGTVTATGGHRAAGIGGGYAGGCSNIVVGTGISQVVATCGDDCNNPIGLGYLPLDVNACTVTVDGSLIDYTVDSTRTLMHPPVIGGYAWNFTVVDGEARIIPFGDGLPATSPAPSGNLEIPSVLGGCPVTVIGNAAFVTCGDITSVTIPDGVTTIGGDAFYACSSLATVTIPASVTTISSRAFRFTGLGTAYVGEGKTASVKAMLLSSDHDQSFVDGITFIETTFVEPWDGNLATLTGNVMALDGMVIHGELAGNYKVSIAAGATVTLSNANVNAGCSLSGTWAGLTCAGDATVILADGSVNTVYGFYDESNNYGDYPGIYVPVGSTLTIAGAGTLNAHGDGAGVRTCQAAGIGGGFEIPCGNIVIAGGTINAYGGSNSAGIGGGYHASCGTISITGGNVTAKNVQSAAGIGSGYSGSCGTITIGSGIVRVVAKSRRVEGQYGEPVGKCLYGASVTVNVDPALTKTEEDTEENYLFYKVWTYEPAASGSYAAWATANGVSGAWDAVDANGIANVFRYAFNKPTGAFTDPPMLDITFNAAGKAVVKTPPLVNGAGFTFTIEASDNVDGTGNAASYPLNASGETVIDETGKTTRFFRLRAVTQ